MKAETAPIYPFYICHLEGGERADLSRNSSFWGSKKSKYLEDYKSL